MTQSEPMERPAMPTRKDINDACRKAGYTATFVRGNVRIYSPFYHSEQGYDTYTANYYGLLDALNDIHRHAYGEADFQEVDE
jgi:hypothetical protein